MSTEYVGFDEDGRPVASFTLPTPPPAQSSVAYLLPYAGAIDGVWTPDGERVERRPTLPVNVSKSTIKANGSDQLVMQDLPASCEVVVNGRSVLVEDGVLTITAKTPRDIEISIDHWPYLRWMTLVTAEEAA